MKTLNAREILRYGRHFSLPEVGLAGQEKLKRASVLLIGAGGLGSPLALYLTAAGVGRIGLVDFDVVDETNLQRQILHDSAMVGVSKLKSAEQRLRGLNPFVELELHEVHLAADNALALFKDYDVIADGSDNFPTRYLVNDVAFLAGRPLVYGAISGFAGQVSVFNYQGGPCYRCLFPEMPPAGSVRSCAEAGVLGVLPGVIGALQAVEVIKILLDIGKPASGRLFLYDALNLSFDTLEIGKAPQCALCGGNPTIHRPTDYEYHCETDARQGKDIEEIGVEACHESFSSMVLIDTREPFEREICYIEGSIHLPTDRIVRELSANPRLLDKKDRIVVYCKYGVGSLDAAGILLDMGFENVRSLKGGMLEWIERIDPMKTRY
uniref:Molybdopterin-synthase adenylyltransferase n=1 Tax=Candidatus Kentrum sp. LPFa TaxID=2126335 RepID=A0A450W1X6_9GAMM|nr:MAG: adenylyltransferase and sulfurtransferase [Candidatus Kentron sp. LPFa]